MVDKSIMTQWQKFSILWQQAGHVEINIHCSYHNYQQVKKALQVAVLITEYLVATSDKLWMR